MQFFKLEGLVLLVRTPNGPMRSTLDSEYDRCRHNPHQPLARVSVDVRRTV